MMHAQAVGVPPAAPGPVTATRVGSGGNRRYELTWTDNSKNETAFVVERRVQGSTEPWTVRATVESSQLGVVPYVETGVGPGTGTRTYTDPIGNTNTLYEYQVYAINEVGDVWDYSDPGLNRIPPGGGWPTLILDSRGGTITTVAAPSDLTGSAAVRNSKTATVSLTWVQHSDNETGFLIQRADNVGFTLGVTNATVGPNATTFTQSVARRKTFYYRVLAFNDAHQSGWSNTATVTTP